MSKPLALQLYTVRDAMAADRAAALARAAGLGFTAVEPFGIGGHGDQAKENIADARAFKQQLDANGLQVVATHGGWTTDHTFDYALDQLAIIGTERLISPAPGTVEGHGDALKSLDGIKRYAEALNWSAEKAEARGFRIGYHNHDFEWAKLEDGRPAYDVFVAELDPRIFLEIDVYWVFTAGLDPVDVITRYADRVELLHIKDGPGGHGAAQVPVGTGDVDNVAAMEAGVNVDHAIIELDGCDGDPYDAAKAGADWLVSGGKATWRA